MVCLGAALLPLGLFALLNIKWKTSWRRDKLNDLAYLLKREIDTVSFISAQRVKELITLETMSSISSDLDREMISAIVYRAPRLFAALVLIDKPEYIQKLLNLKLDDELFKYFKPTGSFWTTKGLIDLSKIGPGDFQKDLYDIHGKFPFPFQDDGVPGYDPSYIFPYKSTKNIASGSFGSVFKVVVAGGHLKGHFLDELLAEKRIKIDEGYQDSTRKAVLREEATLRARKHPNIVPLLASFFATNKQGELSLRLLMPYATGGDLQTWMMSESVPLYPPFLREQTSLTSFIYSSILALISALAYVHADRDGMWTGHYDIKPANILLFSEEDKWVWKLSDFGHSDLKSVGTEPGTDRHIGTLDYEPPEYWTASKREEALSYDVYAMGCVIIQFAAFIVYPDWEENQVRAFHHQRVEAGGDPSQSKNHPFCTKKPVVDRWVGRLRRVHGSRNLERLLDTAEAMMKEDPKQRLLAFDAAIDIWSQRSQGETLVYFQTQCERLTEGQGPRPEFRNSYNPHEREEAFAALYGNDRAKIREEYLTAIGWRKPPTNRLNHSSTEAGGTCIVDAA